MKSVRSSFINALNLKSRKKDKIFMQKRQEDLFEKPLSKKSLLDCYSGDLLYYNDISQYCIVALTSISEKDRRRAINYLERQLGEKVLLGEKVEYNLRRIYWAHVGSKNHQHVVDVPVHIDTLMLESYILPISRN